MATDRFSSLAAVIALLALTDARAPVRAQQPAPAAQVPSPESLETYMVSDKKARDGVLQFVLTRGVGSVTFAPVFERGELRKTLESLRS